jgi:hypothetical protein
MRLVSRAFTAFGLTAVSGLGLVACALDTDPPPVVPPAPIVQHYRIDAIDLPANMDQARAFGFDLDANADRDNQLGAAYATVLAVDSYYQVETPCAQRLSTDVAWLLSIYDSGVNGGAVRLGRGAVIDGELVPLDEVLPAVGRGLDPGDVLTGGNALFPLGAISDGLGDAEPGWVDTELPHITVEAFDANSAVVRIGVALARPDVDRLVVANLARFFTEAIQDGRSEYARDYMDADRDGVITDAEVRNDLLVRGLLAPDLYPDGTGALSIESLSLGVRLIASRL